MTKIHFAVILFGITGLFAKFLHIPSTSIVLGRCVFAVLFLYICLLIKKIPIKTECKTDFLRICLSGTVLGVCWFFFFQSIKISSVAVGLLTYSSVAIFTTLIESFYFRQKPKCSDILLATTAFLGITILVPKFSLSNNTTVGIIFGLIAAFSSGLFSVMSRHIVSKYQSIKTAFIQYSTISLLFIPFLFFKSFIPSVYNISMLAILGVIFTGIANTLFISGLKNVSAAKANIVLSLEPIYGTILAIILLGEHLTLKIAIGGSIVMISAIMATILSRDAPQTEKRKLITEKNSSF